MRIELALGLFVISLILAYQFLRKINVERGQVWLWTILLCADWLIGAYGGFFVYAWIVEQVAKRL